ncbi:MAG TPA: TIGR01777 family oxidoreductase [Bdellovibrionales bacterium]|nr:TIGR01777 family oxidoreductase [Bdellovibrionales bacterium]
MKVLITGATGLIGNELGRRLAEAGHDIIVTSRHVNTAASELSFPAKVFEWKKSTDDFPIEALEGVESIVHLAGESVSARWTNERKKRIRESRVTGTERLVEAVLKSGIGRTSLKSFVLGSAIGIYGDRGDEVLNESSAPGAGFLAEVVKEWEAKVDPLKQMRTRAVIVRTGVVWARHGGMIQKVLPVFQSGLGGQLAQGKQWLSWIHLDDIARLFQFAVENEVVQGVVNGVAPEPLRNDRFTVEFARALGKPVSLPVPESVLKVVLGEMSEAVLGSDRVTSSKLSEWGFQFEHPQAVATLQEIGGPLREGRFEYRAEVWLPKPADEIFPFFSSEKNLELITPSFVGFKVLGMSDSEIRQGTMIDYKLKIHGVPLRWKTKIDEWEPNKRFVDSQLQGPYKEWIHQHEFIPLAGGVLMRDTVLFKLPFGAAGRLIGGWKVTGDVNEIFKFRRKVIAERFGALQ